MGNCCGTAEGHEKLLKETIADHEGPINCMAISADGTVLVTGSEDATARMWTAAEAETECIGVFRGHTGYVNAVAIVEYSIYDRRDEDSINVCAVLTGSADATIRKWDATSCECLFVYEGHTARIQKLFVTGDVLVSSSYDSTAKVWSVDTSGLDFEEEGKACLKTFSGHGKAIYPMIFVPAEATQQVNQESLWGEEQKKPKDLLITGSADMTARAWDFETARGLRIFKGHKGAVTTMSVDSCGQTLFTAGAEGTVISWTVATAQLLRTFEGHAGSVLCLVVSNRLMYTGSTDSSAKCWVKDYGECTRTYKGHRHSVICMKLVNGILFTGSGDGCMRAYSAMSGELKVTYDGHEGAVNCMLLLDNKSYTGSSDCTLRCWDTRELWESTMLNDLEAAVVPQADQITKDEEEGEEDEDGHQVDGADVNEEEDDVGFGEQTNEDEGDEQPEGHRDEEDDAGFADQANEQNDEEEPPKDENDEEGQNATDDEEDCDDDDE